MRLFGIAQSAYASERLQFDENVLILVDQFEELFRYKAQSNSMEDRDEKAAFVKLLLEASRQRDLPIYVAITMRSEFLGDCARFRDLPEALNAGQYLIPRMNREQRRQAIEGPIRMAGGAIAPRLVQRILNEVGEDPGQLPVMQHALLRTWNYWKSKNQPDRPLDFEDYEAVGALDKAVSNHADEVYEEVRTKLPERGAILVRRLFQRLSDRDQYGRQTRRPTSMQELSEVCEAPLWQVGIAVDCFRQNGRSFISTPEEQLLPSTEVDITHECLLTRWDRLSKDWIPEEDESRRVYLRISTRAQDAAIDTGSGDQPVVLSTVHFKEYLTGNGLDRSLAWWNLRQPNSAWARRYVRDDQKPLEPSAIDSNFQLAQRYLAESKKRATRSKFWRFMSVPAFLVVVLIAGAVWIYRQRSEDAIARELLMEAEWASNVAPQMQGFSTDNPRLSAFKAAQSLTHRPSVDAQTVLTSALIQLPQPLQPLGGRKADDVKFSPDGSWLAVAGEQGVDLYDANGKPSRSFAYKNGSTGKPILLFPDNRFFIAAVNDGITIWQLDKGKWIEDDLPCESKVNKVAVSGDGVLVAANCGGHLHFWTPKSSLSITGDEDCDDVPALTLSSDGTRAAYVCTMKGGWIIRLREVTRRTDSAPFISAPNAILASLPTETNKPSVSLGAKDTTKQGHRNPLESAEFWSSPQVIKDLRFDPAGSNVLIIAGSDGTVRSWSPHRQTTQSDTGSWKKRQRQAIPNQKSGENALNHAAEGYPLMSLPASPEIISFSEDGKWITVVEANRTAKVWDTSEISGERLIAHLALDRKIQAIAVSRAGNHIAAVTDDGLVHLWKLDGTRQDFPEMSRLRTHGSYLVTHTFSSQGQDIFSGNTNIFDTRNGKIASSFPNFSLGIHSSYRPLTISVDGTLVAGIEPGSLVVNEFNNGKIGKERWRCKLMEPTIYMTSFDFSSDNRFLGGAVADGDKISVAMWDISKEGAREIKAPVKAGEFFTLSPGFPRVEITNPQSGLRMYDGTTDRATAVEWGKNFVYYDFAPSGKAAIGVELNGRCKPQPASAQQKTTNADNSDQPAESLVRIVDPDDGKEQSNFKIEDLCIQNFEVSKDSRYLLTLLGKPEDADHPTMVQLWDIASDPPAMKAEIRNGAPLLDASITPDSRIVLLDRKRFIVTPWRAENLNRELCARLIPNTGEMKDYGELCSNQPQLPTW